MGQNTLQRSNSSTLPLSLQSPITTSLKKSKSHMSVSISAASHGVPSGSFTPVTRPLIAREFSTSSELLQSEVIAPNFTHVGDTMLIHMSPIFDISKRVNFNNDMKNSDSISNMFDSGFIAENQSHLNGHVLPSDNDDGSDNEDIRSEIYIELHENTLRSMRTRWSEIQQLRAEISGVKHEGQGSYAPGQYLKSTSPRGTNQYTSQNSKFNKNKSPKFSTTTPVDKSVILNAGGNQTDIVLLKNKSPYKSGGGEGVADVSAPRRRGRPPKHNTKYYYYLPVEGTATEESLHSDVKDSGYIVSDVHNTTSSSDSSRVDRNMTEDSSQSQVVDKISHSDDDNHMQIDDCNANEDEGDSN
jgi:hypothetical protein